MKNLLSHMILLSLLLGACNGFRGDIPSTCDKDELYFSTGVEVEICFEDSAVLMNGQDRITYQYIGLVEDSRCPEADSIVCVWAGRAIVQLGIEDQIFELGLGDLSSDSLLTSFVNHLGYMTELVDVKPLALESDNKPGKSIVIRVEED